MNALLGRLKTALDAQRKFIADAAHQLRTPLTAVKLHAEQAAVARDTQQTYAALRELRAVPVASATPERSVQGFQGVPEECFACET